MATALREPRYCSKCGCIMIPRVEQQYEGSFINTTYIKHKVKIYYECSYCDNTTGLEEDKL